jgi:hypothetical protein
MTSHGRIARITDGAASELAIVAARGAEDWGVAVLHGGEAVAFLTPAQARADAARLEQMAWLCENPGKCPIAGVR